MRHILTRRLGDTLLATALSRFIARGFAAFAIVADTKDNGLRSARITDLICSPIRRELRSCRWPLQEARVGDEPAQLHFNRL
jgi:hypothetical protein